MLVVEQYPKKNKNIVIGSNVYIRTNSDRKVMVDITGFTKAEVKTLLNFMNVDYELNGTGNVISTNIPVGEEIKEKIIITLG